MNCPIWTGVPRPWTENTSLKSIDDRSVKALAADLYTDDRREQLGLSIDALVLRVRELPVAREAALFLAADIDLAWRLFALGLLAEELAE